MKIKTLLPLFIVHDKHFKEYFRIMRISLVMLFVCIFQMVAVNSEAQNTIIKLETDVLSVGQLINQIEKQTDYLVVFRNREVNTERSITVHKKQEKSFLIWKMHSRIRILLTNLTINTFYYSKRMVRTNRLLSASKAQKNNRRRDRCKRRAYYWSQCFYKRSYYRDNHGYGWKIQLGYTW